MGKQIPGDIRDVYDNLPPGWYLGTVTGLEESTVDINNQGPVFVLKAQLRVVEPKELANRMHFETFWIGDHGDPSKNIPSDPMADMAITWQRRGGQFKKMCAAAGVQVEQSDTDTVAREMQNKPLMFKLDQKINDGKVYVNAKDWAMPGTQRPEVHEVATKQHVAAPAPAPTPPPVPPAGHGTGPAAGGAPGWAPPPAPAPAPYAPPAPGGQPFAPPPPPFQQPPQR